MRSIAASRCHRRQQSKWDAQVRDEEIVIELGSALPYPGLKKNLAFDVLLKVNVLIARGDAFHVDTLDLYSCDAGQLSSRKRPRSCMSRGCDPHDLGKVLRKLKAQERTIEQR